MSDLSCIEPRVIPNPVGIDVVINKLQESMANIPWLEKSFGKAFIMKEEQNGRVITLPKCWIGSNEFVTMYPNDTVKAFSFIESFEDESISNYQTYKYDHMSEFDLSIVVFANLDRIDNNLDYIYTEPLQSDVYNELKDIPEILEINRVKRGIDRSYSNWSIESIKPTYYRPKYTAFKIELTAILSSACYNPNNFNIQTCLK